METKLKTAAELLPTPSSDFTVIASKAGRRTPTHRSRLRPALIAAAVIVLLTAGVTANRYCQVQRSMWVVTRSNLWTDAQSLTDEYTIPQEMAGYPFYSVVELSVVPTGTPLAEAMLTSFFRPVSINYAYDNYPEGITYGPSISLGNTDSPYWETYFDLNEDGFVDHEHLVPGSLHTVDYANISVQIYQTEHTVDDNTRETVIRSAALWVDVEKGYCIVIHMCSDDMDVALYWAKVIIDLNT